MPAVPTAREARVRLLARLSLSALLLTTANCAKVIGDECQSDAECGTGRVCDRASRGGYCTVTPCQPGTCPEDSACIEFENEETYCMALCEDNDDCRTGYTCTAYGEDVTYCRQRG